MGKNGGRTTAHVQAFGMRISARAPFRPQSGGGPSECRLCLANTGRSLHSRKANELFLQTGGRGQRTAGKLRQVAQNLPFGVQEKESRPDCGHMKRWNSCRGKGNGFFQAEKCKKPDLSFWRNPALLSMPFLFRLFPKPLEQATFSQKKRLSPNFRFATAPTLWTFQGNKALIWQTPCYGFRGSR